MTSKQQQSKPGSGPGQSGQHQHSFDKYCSKVNVDKTGNGAGASFSNTQHQIPALSKTTSTILPESARERDDDTMNEVYYATHPIETQLLHASVIVRHGARAPYRPLQCWNGYNYDSDIEGDTSKSNKWDCPNDVTNYMTTSPKASALATLTEQGLAEEELEGHQSQAEGQINNEAGGSSSSMSSWYSSITSWFHGSNSGVVGSSTNDRTNAYGPVSVPESECYGHRYGCRGGNVLPYFLLDKQYDALRQPEHNYLGGTCALGQLLKEGYDQHYANGQILRDTYLNNTNNQTFMNLFQGIGNFGNTVPTASTTEPINNNIQSSFYLRSDDEQRTLLSLQVLFESFWGYGGSVEDTNSTSSSTSNIYSSSRREDNVPTVIPLHTADLSLDVMDENDKVCPMLDVVRMQAELSGEYVDRYSQARVKGGIIQQIQSKLGTPDDMLIDGNFIDCMMTQYCTDGRDVPDFLKQDNYDMFQQAYDYFTWEYYYPFQYNNGQYSKLAMGPLWQEILEPIQQARTLNITTLDGMDMAQQPTGGTSTPIPRMSLFSGHDDTLTALMMSLSAGSDANDKHDVWDGQWVPYGSMLIVEHHAIQNQEAQYDLFPSGHAFRLLYNGQVRTPKIEGCSPESDLCDLDILLDLVGAFAGKNSQGCQISADQQTILDTRSSASTAVPPGQVSMMTVLSLALCALLVSTALTTAIVVRRIRRAQRLTREPNHQQQQLDLSEEGTGVEIAQVSSQFTIGDDDEEDEDAHVHADENQII